MNPKGWQGQLAVYKELMDLAEQRFAVLTDGLDHPRIDTARGRIENSADALARVAGGLSGWTRTWFGAVLLGIAAWAVATVAGPLAGLPAGWTITVTVTVVLAAHLPVFLLTNALAERVNRRRTRRRAEPVSIVEPEDPDPAVAVIELLWAVRDGLATVLRQWPEAYIIGVDRLASRDRHLYWASVADRDLCVAIDSIEIWRDTREADR
ncbi:hypothetical protein DFJ67_4895 [Asanoa ferruginea]|uniref:Uncharacterized protein n=1 Tax=Asanoa ferruginea TaxID=53367 RepID=A0A3D9ZYH1_9ACTN|nr:hypothetical protein [Asanoa ferruginea]REF98870.1 hypothetical protein DFJ67_4895 [Asanoa ferruginea]